MKRSRIVSVRAIEAYSDRMTSAIKVYVETESGKTGSSLICSGLSTGKYEKPFLYDADSRFSGKGCRKAVDLINAEIGKHLIGLDAGRQHLCDEVLLSFGKERVGANTTAAISTAILFAGAESLGIPVYKHIGGVRASTLPVPSALAASGSARYGNSVQCGYKPSYYFVSYGYETYSEASKALWETFMAWNDLMKEKLKIKMQPIAGMAIPKGKLPDDFALWELLADAINISGNKGKVGLSVDVAAACFYNHEKKVYEGLFSEGSRTREEQIDLIVSMTKDYPFLIVEDPLMEDDFEGFSEITARTDIQITADDLTASDKKRVETAISEKAGNAIKVVTSQIGTVSEIIDLALFAKERGFGIVTSGERGEGLASCDYAVGLNAGTAGENGMCYSGNRLLQIESELGRRARFFGQYGIKGKRFQLSD